tara:strand:- start:4761 stop:5378 length:618 start_codon:yes stop_codon:yes gene_type:complete
MKNIISTSINQNIIKSAFSYSEFNNHVETLLEKGESTDRKNTENNLGYTRLNIQRTNRWDKRGKLDEETIQVVKAIETPQTWLIITEGWCGDSAQVLPFINKIAELNSNISLRIILREEHPEVMDEFLTNGKSRSIPKIIILDSATLNVLGEWGPRPSEINKTYLSERVDPSIGGKEASKNLHIWYARDKGKVIQKEFIEVLKSI